MRIADLSQIDRSTAIYHIAFTVLNGVFNYTALYCLNYHIFFFHRLIMPLENFFENFCRNFAKTAPSMRKLVEWEKIPVLRIGRRYIIRIDVIHKFMEANQGADLLVREQVRAVR